MGTRYRRPARTSLIGNSPCLARAYAFVRLMPRIDAAVSTVVVSPRPRTDSMVHVHESGMLPSRCRLGWRSDVMSSSFRELVHAGTAWCQSSPTRGPSTGSPWTMRGPSTLVRPTVANEAREWIDPSRSRISPLAPGTRGRGPTRGPCVDHFHYVERPLACSIHIAIFTATPRDPGRDAAGCARGAPRGARL